MKTARKLAPGTLVRVSGGPVYRLADGTRVRMGERGVGVVVRLSDCGQIVWVRFAGETCARSVYIGPEYISPRTGVLLRPHRVRRVRRRNKAPGPHCSAGRGGTR